MEKQIINVAHSRARAEIHTHGGRVVGWHRSLPLVFAVPPVGGPVWPVNELVEVFGGLRRIVRTSCIGGCTVIWQ
ncbi:hypothetical protein ACFEPA_003752 [Salmonella enterica]|uniref:hypothetical protein n=1 Tax=Salmonella enterica TaxID=28901 RepID=UPI0012727CB8|nr:hypothetical protein [Salmonella enterica]EAM4785492.1 hypothetical protein [Salmonella enterica]EAN0345582.1 hypothetical protein [Salmonella enterica]EAN8040766.1 hypothetical protein [Salmonella enterica]EAP7766978.1 hypothetical protein [Salmonella enterica]EAR9486984.1 hypothetical protein [Salmonella enterica]